MPFPANTLTCDLVIKTRQARRRSRLYFEPSVAPDGHTDVEKMAEAVFGKFAPLVTALMPDEYLFERVEARYYGAGGTDLEGNSESEAVEGELEYTNLGSAGTDAQGTHGLPDESALIIQRRTGKGGRSKRGRLFITGLSEQVQRDGVIDPDLADECRALADAITDTIAVSDLVAAPGDSDLNARHYDRKNNVLEPMNKCYALATIGSRRDRRQPLELERL